jgi:hypothetical protein
MIEDGIIKASLGEVVRFKKFTMYIYNNFNPEDRRRENLFNCGMTKNISVLPYK